MARTWSVLAKASGVVHNRLLEFGSKDQDDRAGWIAPAFSLELRSEADRQRRESACSAARAWLAKHYRHESLDLHDLVDSDNFFETAALDCSRSDEAPSETSLDLGLADESASSLGLSGRKMQCEVSLRLLVRGSGTDTPEVALDVVKPADERLHVVEGLPAVLKLTPQVPRTITFVVKWDEGGGGEVNGSPPRGLIVRARLPNQRAYHLLVPLSIQPARSVPQLVLRTDPAGREDLAFDRIRLRAVPGRVSYFLLVKNPSSVAREVNVEVLAGSNLIIKSPKAFPVKEGATVPVPSFGPLTVKPNERLEDAPAGLKLRLRDAGSDQILDEQSLQPTIATPAEYLEVTQARFVPAVSGQPNRLEITFRPLPQMTGPDCLIKLIIPADKEIFPAFQGPPEGKLEGELKPGSAGLELYAQGIKLDPAADEEGHFLISVDNLQRVIWYQTRFIAQEGKPQVAREVHKPRVRFQPEVVFKPAEPTRLRVAFLVDNAPANSKLVFELGRLRGGKIVGDIPRWEAEAKRRHLGFDPKGEGGALLFEASVEDWVKEFDIPQILGVRRLQASLIDPRSREVFDTWGMDLVLDDLPPRKITLEVPAEIEKGRSQLEVKATVQPPASGIKEAAFALVGKAEFADAEAKGKTVPGKPTGGDHTTWEAILPLKDATGKLTVTVRFKSGVGLTALESADVVVQEPPPAPAQAAAKPSQKSRAPSRGK